MTVMLPAGRVSLGVPQASGIPVHGYSLGRHGQPGGASPRRIRTVSLLEFFAAAAFAYYNFLLAILILIFAYCALYTAGVMLCFALPLS